MTVHKLSTVGDLIEELKEFPSNFYWYGCDDESIIIVDLKGDDYGYIRNENVPLGVDV